MGVMDIAEKARLFRENVNRARAGRGLKPMPLAASQPRVLPDARPRSRAASVERLYPCRFLLPILSRTDAAGLECSCPGKWLRGCEVHGQCRIDQESVDGCCRTCEQRRALPIATMPSAQAVEIVQGKGGILARFDHHNLYPEITGKRFNASLMAHGDGYALAFRNTWAGSEINVATLDRDFRPLAVKHLPLTHVRANYGREDPRFFRHNGELFIEYIGVTGKFGPTHVLYARLSESFDVLEKFAPHFPKRKAWEKNWGFFSHGGELFAVYSIAPHRVLRIEGNKAELAFEEANPFPWEGGERRGGPSPQLASGEWWSFFHDRIERNGRQCYRTGFYAFENKPPFRPIRQIPAPVLWPSEDPHDNYADVAFTCGAVVEKDRVILSSGMHDRWIDIQAIDRRALEASVNQAGA